MFKLLGDWVGLSFPNLWPPLSVGGSAISLAAQARTWASLASASCLVAFVSLISLTMDSDFVTLPKFIISHSVLLFSTIYSHSCLSKITIK